MSDIVDTYQSQLTAAMSEAIEEGRLQGVISDDKILLGDLSDLCGEQEGDYLAEIFHKSSPEVVYLTTDRVLAEYRITS